MMTITAYIFDYTLNVVFEGNRSECARSLGSRRTDFNRIEQRVREGATSIRTLESILLLFCERKISLDQVLSGYQIENDALHDFVFLQKEHDEIRILREALAKDCLASSNRMRVFKAAEAFLAELEHSFCSASCKAKRDCKTECPCKRFAEYMDWLRSEFDKSNAEKT